MLTVTAQSGEAPAPQDAQEITVQKLRQMGWGDILGAKELTAQDENLSLNPQSPCNSRIW